MAEERVESKGKEETHLAVFNGKNIRRKIVGDNWFFSIVDVIAVLTDSQGPRNYWKVLKHRLIKEGSEVVTFCNQLKLISSDGKEYLTDCADTEGILRIIQSIPSKKAEPFKRWLAKVGYERIQEIDNPELAQQRMKRLYEMKGYPKDWIEKRIRGIAIRQELTEEWKKREVLEEIEFAILTNEITKATFGKTIQEYKAFKGLDKSSQNLRDHMTDWELILTMISEKATTDITTAKDSRGFEECKNSALEGGTIARNTRKEIEEKTGKSIVSKENFVGLTENKGLKKIKRTKDRFK